MTLDDLLAGHCTTRKRGDPGLSGEEVEELRKLVPGWEVTGQGTRIRRRFRFDGFTAAVEFVCRLAPLANAEDHHPDFSLTKYRQLDIAFKTNSIGGLSLNDFIMAAKLDAVYERTR